MDDYRCPRCLPSWLQDRDGTIKMDVVLSDRHSDRTIRQTCSGCMPHAHDRTLNQVSSAMAQTSRFTRCSTMPRDTESTPFRGESVGHLTLKDIQVSLLKKMQFENGSADAES